MEADLRSLLTGDATLSGLVSTRIYWGIIPQSSERPNVRMQKVSHTVNYTMSKADNLEMSLVQIDVFGVTFASAIAVSNAVKAKLSAFSGTEGTTIFEGIFLRTLRQMSEKPDTTIFHRFSMDFEVWHKPA